MTLQASRFDVDSEALGLESRQIIINKYNDLLHLVRLESQNFPVVYPAILFLRCK